MKPTLEIESASGQRCQIKLSPSRVVVSIPYTVTIRRYDQIVAFAEYVLNQFVDINETWVGLITFRREAVTWARTVLRSGTKNRKYEAVI